jgi:hypothetical protein
MIFLKFIVGFTQPFNLCVAKWSTAFWMKTFQRIAGYVWGLINVATSEAVVTSRTMSTLVEKLLDWSRLGTNITTGRHGFDVGLVSDFRI